MRPQMSSISFANRRDATAHPDPPFGWPAVRRRALLARHADRQRAGANRPNLLDQSHTHRVDALRRGGEADERSGAARHPPAHGGEVQHLVETEDHLVQLGYR